jgi:hypothetical protein
MKKIFFISLVTAAGFVSCNKVLDTKPLNSLTGEDVWSNYSLAEGYIFTSYANTMGNIFSWNRDALTKSILNEDWGGAYVNEKTEQMDRNTDEGWSNFENIRRVNLAIANLQTAPFTELQKNTLLGEAYFQRSSIYYRLAQFFGGVQIIKDVLTTESDFYIPRSSAKETYDFILSDLDSAATLLPPLNQKGRATKGAAYALSMRVALQAGAFLNDNAYYQRLKRMETYCLLLECIAWMIMANCLQIIQPLLVLLKISWFTKDWQPILHMMALPCSHWCLIVIMTQKFLLLQRRNSHWLKQLKDGEVSFQHRI